METYVLLYYALLLARVIILTNYDRHLGENTSFIGGNLLSTMSLVTICSTYFTGAHPQTELSAGVLFILVAAWEIRSLNYRWEAWREAAEDDPEGAEEDSFEGLQVGISAAVLLPAMYCGASLLISWARHAL